MIEGRAIIKSISDTGKLVESLGGEFRSHYVLKDIIFIPKKENFNLSDDFVRIRENIVSDWPTKKVIVIRKQTKFEEVGKIDKVILRKEFDNIEEAFNFTEENIPEFEVGFEYQRKGWQYQLNNNRVFIEDIEKWKPSIEIEAKDEEELRELFDKLKIIKEVKSSVPEIIRQIQ